MHDRRFRPEHAHRLISPEREAEWQPRRFLADLGLPPGITVADLGCGPGFWTLPLAEGVGPNGRVWAVDVSPQMLDMLRRRGRPDNVIPLVAALPHVPLRDHSVDWVWTAFTFHEVLPFEAFAAALARLVRPGGRVWVLEWRPDAQRPHGPPRDHRLWPADVVAYLEEAGLQAARLHWQNADTYLIVAEGPA